MPTTIQIDEKTRDELFKVVADLQARTGRRVTFNEAIMVLIQRARGIAEARARFEVLFGTLRGERAMWRELRALRSGEVRRLEQIAKTAR